MQNLWPPKLSNSYVNTNAARCGQWCLFYNAEGGPDEVALLVARRTCPKIDGVGNLKRQP